MYRCGGGGEELRWPPYMVNLSIGNSGKTTISTDFKPQKAIFTVPGTSGSTYIFRMWATRDGEKGFYNARNGTTTGSIVFNDSSVTITAPSNIWVKEHGSTLIVF